MISAKKKNELLKRLYDKPKEYHSIEVADDNVAAGILKEDGYAVIANVSFTNAVKITKEGISFYEIGGYEKEEKEQNKKAKSDRSKITRKDIITWTISILAVVLSFLLGRYLGRN